MDEETLKATQHWDAEWTKRAVPEGEHAGPGFLALMTRNMEKTQTVLKALAARPYYTMLEKLEIGCSNGVHAAYLNNRDPMYLDKWTGIDLSEVAISRARRAGMNAHVADIMTWEPGRKFEAFIMLDSLEHILDHERLANKILALATPVFRLFSNIPMYCDAMEFEKPMDVNAVAHFVHRLGCHKFWHKIYGSFGYPYMMFETSNGERDVNLDGIVDFQAKVKKLKE